MSLQVTPSLYLSPGPTIFLLTLSPDAHGDDDVYLDVIDIADLVMLGASFGQTC